MAFRTSPKEITKAIGIGIATAVLLSLVIVPLTRAGLSPFPRPLGLAFAQTILGPVPLPAGLLAHVLYVTAWSVFFVLLFRRLTLGRTLLFSLGLWLLVLIVFFPVVGWGFLGLNVGPQLIIGSLLIHILFAFVLWGLCRLAFGSVK